MQILKLCFYKCVKLKGSATTFFLSKYKKKFNKKKVTKNSG